MAKYYVTHECGHEQCHQLIGPGKDRERRLEWLTTTICSECYQAELAKKRAEATEAAKAEAIEQDLPALSGTEKQIAWAIRIRSKLLNEISDKVDVTNFDPFSMDVDPKTINEFLEFMTNQLSASWWIDNRNATPWLLMDRFRKSKPQKDIESIDEIIVKSEATLRPETPSVEIPTEIKIKDNQVVVYLPSKNEKLREIMKAERYKWDNGWKRTYNSAKTDITDRAAEIASKLLAAGFVLQIMDTTLREKVISGNYAPEKTRWVAQLTSGSHTGWFAITWGRNEDFYQAARKIAGSRYDKPSVIIPPANYDEVLDFARMYDFSLTAGAESVVSTQKEIRASALVVSPKIKRAAKVTQITTPPVLDIQEAEVFDEFKD